MSGAGSRGAISLALAIVLAGCTGGAAPDVSATPSPGASASAVPLSTATPVTEIVVGGTRPVTFHLPPGAGTTPAPLVIAIHGFGGSGAELASYFRLSAEAATRGIVVAYPEGTPDADANRFWNATDACCNIFGSDVDDVAYLVGLIEEIGRATPIDPKRVYVVGHSNGGFMAHRMACDAAATVAAIVGLGGATYGDPAKCAPSEPVAVVQIHGTDDDTVLFGGGRLDFGGSVPAQPYPGAEATVLAWAAHDGCGSELETAPDMLDLARGIDGPSGPAETMVEAAQGCAPGGAAELWAIRGGGHAPDLTATFASTVIDFLLDHPKP